MGNLTRYTSSDLPALLDKISKNSIGMNDYLNRVFDLHETTSNYPPYNLITVSNTESRLELALAGFKKKEVNVYTQDGKLFVEGQKEDKETETTYLHKDNIELSPYNLITVSNTESRLELALAGFKKKEVNVYTQDGKRLRSRAWTLSDDTEVRSVDFEDGLLSITLGRIVPTHHQRKDWF